MPAERFIVNVEGVIFRDGKYLMAMRGEGEEHAPGTLALFGGKVETSGNLQDVLEETLRREILEEAGVVVEPELVYLESKVFLTDWGEPVVDVVFLCKYWSGTPAVSDPEEVASIHWMTLEEILAHPKSPAWTRRSIELAAERLSAAS